MVAEPKAGAMNRIHEDATADIQFEIRWDGENTSHTEGYESYNVNFWRDCLPESLVAELEGKKAGDVIDIDFDTGIVVSPFDPKNVFDVRRAQFNRRFTPDRNTEPRMGRFYPKGILKGIAGIFSENLHPFRCVGVDNGHLSVDVNHPLAEKAIRLRALVKDVREKRTDRGGLCYHWMELLSDGPGMQTRWGNQPTDFFSDTPFKREDEHPDHGFYERPRLVQHLDTTAVDIVSGIYGRFLTDGMKVLDLMGSWTSHIPQGLNLKKLTGLGLNRRELDENPRLTDRMVHDLNQAPNLPFETETYDAVICTVSIEYLIHPVAVFKEVARVLRSGGRFVVTFSNRWFPSKAINVWKELHDFERMGLVLEYFQKSGKFKNLKTYSMRGLLRPPQDKYFPEQRLSDPVFAVWGRKF